MLGVVKVFKTFFFFLGGGGGIAEQAVGQTVVLPVIWDTMTCDVTVICMGRVDCQQTETKYTQFMTRFKCAHLAHWVREEMAIIVQTTFSIAFDLI